MKTELTTCGDTGQYGMIVWLGTTSEKIAKGMRHNLDRHLNDKLIKIKRPKESLEDLFLSKELRKSLKATGLHKDPSMKRFFKKITKAIKPKPKKGKKK